MTLRAIYYDTETTGIKTKQDRIVEIAAFDPERDKSFEALVNPGIPIPAEASAVHHISDDMVKDSPDFAVVGQQFIDFCDGDVVLIAHNNDNFDLPMITSEFERHNLEMPEWKTLDSLKWARRYRSDLPRHPLQFLRETYGFPENNAHRALDDVIMLHQIFLKMIDDLTIDQVYALLNKPRAVSRMPFGKYQGQSLKDVPATYIEWLGKNGVFDKPENKELKETFVTLGLLS